MVLFDVVEVPVKSPKFVRGLSMYLCSKSSKTFHHIQSGNYPHRVKQLNNSFLKVYLGKGIFMKVFD